MGDLRGRRLTIPHAAEHETPLPITPSAICGSTRRIETAQKAKTRRTLICTWHDYSPFLLVRRPRAERDACPVR
jgi:hypothetical protein